MASRMQGISTFWTMIGCVHVYGLLVRPMLWPLALLEIADRSLINALRLKLFGLSMPSSGGFHHAVICPHTMRSPGDATAQAASLGR